MKLLIFLPIISLCSFHFSGNDTVTLGKSGNVQIPRKEFNYTKAAHKPTAMTTLHLVDTIFSRETLLRSTVYGTKDFAPLDHEIINAIKGKLDHVYFR